MIMVVMLVVSTTIFLDSRVWMSELFWNLFFGQLLSDGKQASIHCVLAATSSYAIRSLL